MKINEEFTIATLYTSSVVMHQRWERRSYERVHGEGRAEAPHARQDRGDDGDDDEVGEQFAGRVRVALVDDGHAAARRDAQPRLRHADLLLELVHVDDVHVVRPAVDALALDDGAFGQDDRDDVDARTHHHLLHFALGQHLVQELVPRDKPGTGAVGFVRRLSHYVFFILSNEKDGAPSVLRCVRVLEYGGQ